MEDYYFTLEAIDDKKIIARLWNYNRVSGDFLTKERRVEIASSVFDVKTLSINDVHAWALAQATIIEEGVTTAEFLMEHGVEHQLQAAEPAPSIPAWVQPTGAHDAYAKGALVSHNGTTWESTTEANVWEPGVSGWKETVKVGFEK